MPTLRELEARLVIYSPEGGRDIFQYTETVAQAHGVDFICPKSYQKHGGVIGAHHVRCYFRGSPVPLRIGVNKKGETVRWSASGATIDDLSLSPSIQTEDDCAWHGWIGNAGVPKGSAA